MAGRSSLPLSSMYWLPMTVPPSVSKLTVFVLFAGFEKKIPNATMQQTTRTAMTMAMTLLLPPALSFVTAAAS